MQLLGDVFFNFRQETPFWASRSPSSTSPQYALARSWNQRQEVSDKQPSTPVRQSQGQSPIAQEHPDTSIWSEPSFPGRTQSVHAPFLWVSMAKPAGPCYDCFPLLIFWWCDPFSLFSIPPSHSCSPLLCLKSGKLESTCMRFPLRHGACQGESEARKENVRAQTSITASIHISLRWTRCLSLLTFHVHYLFVLHCSNAATVQPVSNVTLTLRIWYVIHPSLFVQQNMNDSPAVT